MGLVRFLPTPSDRMGILWSLLAIDQCAIIEYGPAGTTHYSMGLFKELGERQQNRLFTTHMSEEDVIMGDVSRLEKAIVEVDESFKPKVIFIVASSVAAVIGTDIKGVCNYMQDRVKAKLVTFDQGGFRGDYSVGLAESCKMLVKEIVDTDIDPEADKDENLVNLIGFSMGSYRSFSDRNEIEFLLEKGFGLKVGACLCGETDIDKIKNAGRASLNIVLREEGLPAATMLRNKFGTKTVVGAPYGYKGTMEWLAKISKAINREISPFIQKELMERMQASSYYPMYMRLLKLNAPKAALVGEYRQILGIGQFLTELGIKPCVSICQHSAKCIPNVDESVTFCKKEKERLDIMKDLSKTLILADDASMSVCSKDNTFLRISMPVIHGSQVAKHLPLMGYHGADFIAEAVEEYFRLLK